MAKSPLVSVIIPSHNAAYQVHEPTGKRTYVYRGRERLTGSCYSEFFWANRITTSTVLVTRRSLEQVGLKFHLVGGAFQIGARVYKCYCAITSNLGDSPLESATYDEPYPLGALVVSSPMHVGEAANLYPEMEVHATATCTDNPEHRPVGSAWSAADRFGAANRADRLERVDPSQVCRP